MSIINFILNGLTLLVILYTSWSMTKLSHMLTLQTDAFNRDVKRIQDEIRELRSELSELKKRVETL